MAKDPAVLFYTSDFLSGTFTMTHEQVGKYIRLLCIQHQKGVLSEKDMINVCGTYDEDVFLKFEKAGKTFFNKRMKEEADRRQNFCESRRKSRQGTKNQTNNKKSYVKRMETEAETENITEDVNTTENFGKSENLLLIPEMFEIFKKHLPNYPGSVQKDYKPLYSIAQFFCEIGKLPGSADLHFEKIMEVWEPVSIAISKDNFYKQKSLSTISNHIQEITQNVLYGKSTSKNGKPNLSPKETAAEFDRLFTERYGNGRPATGENIN